MTEHGINNKGPYDLSTRCADAIYADYGTTTSPEQRVVAFADFLTNEVQAIREPAPGVAGIGNGADIINFASIERAYTTLFRNENLGLVPSLKGEANMFWEELNRMKDPRTGTVTPSQIETALKAQQAR